MASLTASSLGGRCGEANLVLNNLVGHQRLPIVCEIQLVADEAVVLMAMCPLDVCV
jgi:hypothetical protein